jgi:hypothetical protein
MDGERNRQRADTGSRSFLPRVATAPSAWRTVWQWLFGDCADIDPEGLLAERTPKIAPRRPRRDESGTPDAAPDESA